MFFFIYVYVNIFSRTMCKVKEGTDKSKLMKQVKMTVTIPESYRCFGGCGGCGGGVGGGADGGGGRGGGGSAIKRDTLSFKLQEKNGTGRKSVGKRGGGGGGACSGFFWWGGVGWGAHRPPCRASYLATMFLQRPSSFLKSATSMRRAEFSFSRKLARMAIWFSFSRRASRDRLAATLFFLRRAQYRSSWRAQHNGSGHFKKTLMFSSPLSMTQTSNNQD